MATKVGTKTAPLATTHKDVQLRQATRISVVPSNVINCYRLALRLAIVFEHGKGDVPAWVSAEFTYRFTKPRLGFRPAGWTFNRQCLSP